MLGFRIPQRNLEDLLGRLNRKPFGPLACEFGVRKDREADVTEYLFRSVLGHWGRGKKVPGRTGKPLVLVTARQRGSMVTPGLERLVRDSGAVAGLSLCPRAKHLSFECAAPGCEHIPYVSIPGPGMSKTGVALISDGKKRLSVAVPPDGAEARLQYRKFDEKYGRLGGAIGLGNRQRGLDILRRASTLRVTVIGAGRAGSALVLRLAKAGVGSQAGVTVADPDVLEEANLPDMPVPDRAVGLPKAEAVAMTAAAFCPGFPVRPLNAGLGSEEVVEAVAESDVVFSCVDEDAARLGVAVLAARYHVVHVDLTGGAARKRRGDAVLGGAVRIFVPGTQPCLACTSSADWSRAEELLGMGTEAERRRRSELDWTEQKAGSSADVLNVVLGEGMQMFWALLRGEVTSSVWLQYGHDSRGVPRWSNWTRRARKRCPVCSGQAGRGDAE